MNRLHIAASIILLAAEALSASVLLVPGDYQSIQSAINSSSPNDTIICSPGDYYECLLINEHVLTLASMFILNQDSSTIEQTVLHPDPTQQQRRVVEVIGPMTGTIALVGLTVRDGHLDYTIRHWNGGAGLYAREVDIRIESSIFRADTADYGAAVRLDSCNTQFLNNHVLENISIPGYHGGVRSYYGTMIMSGNVISNNFGGGFYMDRFTYGDISFNFIENNIGYTTVGGMLMSGNFLPPETITVCTIRNNVFSGNRAIEGAGLRIALVDISIIKDNFFINNTTSHPVLVSGHAGGLQITQGDSCLITGNTFIGNRALQYAGALEIMASATVEKNRFIGNQGGVVGCISVFRSGSINPFIQFNRNLFEGNGCWTASPSASEYRGAIVGFSNTRLDITQSDFYGQVGNTVERNPANVVVTLSDNYWGHPTGPYHSILNESGLGDTLENDHFIPWSAEHFWAANVEPDTNLVEFGLVAEGVTAYSSLLLTNTGVETLVVRGGFLGDPAFSLDLGIDSLVLASDESAEVLLRFVAQDEEAHLDTLRFDCNDPEAFRETVELRANVTAAIPGGGDPDNLPKKFELAPAQPNPFNPSTLIRIELPTIGRVRVELFNLLGQRVALLHDAPLQAGYHSFTLDGSRLTSGLYLVRASSPVHGTGVQKVLLLK